jgi:hypothetical protein
MYVFRQFLIATLPIFAFQQQLVGQNTSTPGCTKTGNIFLSTPITILSSQIPNLLAIT